MQATGLLKIKFKAIQMYIEQLYTNCLAEAAYYIESAGEAIIIDPIREPEPYLNLLSTRGAQLKYIIETHFHADFVSGHLELSAKTGAPIVFGPTAETTFESIIAIDEQQFKVGNCTLTVLHTPGHTPESACFLLADENNNPYAVFTGDTLFIGDVGRPDLAIKSNLTQEDLAGMLFDSLQKKIIPLPDNVIVYPAHGAGSSCGKNISSERFSTIGRQKKTNYALQSMSKEEFVNAVTTGIMPPPQYFPKNATINKTGYSRIDDILTKGLTPLTPIQFQNLITEGAIVIDTRPAQVFAKAHVPGSINIGIDGQFAIWAATVITDINQKILLVVDKDREKEAITRLARVGYDNTLGYLNGGFEAWLNAAMPIETIVSISAVEFAKTHQNTTTVLDVRKPGEYNSSHLSSALNYPLDYLEKEYQQLSSANTFVIHCKGGYRSMVAASFLKHKGFKNVIDVAGGYDAIEKAL